MKTALRISLILNLLAALAFVWANHFQTAISPTPLAIKKTGPPARSATVSAPPVVRQAKPQPFRWSQLESSDYHTYVKNLRLIGCPETSVRAIVATDVDAVYGLRCQELKNKLTDYDHGSWSEKLRLMNLRQDWLAELRKIPEEKTLKIADLLGLPSPAGNDSAVATASLSQADRATTASADVASITSVVAQAGTVSSSQAGAASLTTANMASAHPTARNRHAAQAVPSLPLVLRDVNLSQLNFNDQQIQTIKDLRQTFINEIGGPNQNPNDPDYLARWLKAQTDVENLARGLLGVMPWETYQIAVANQAQ